MLEAVKVCVVERDSYDTNWFWWGGEKQGVSWIFFDQRLIAVEIFLRSLNGSRSSKKTQTKAAFIDEGW